MVSPSRLGIALAIVALQTCEVPVTHAELVSAIVRVGDSPETARYDAVVESARQTVIAAQVSGAVIELPVKAGDTVKAGQILVRIDARSALQATLASQAQTQAARSHWTWQPKTLNASGIYLKSNTSAKLPWSDRRHNIGPRRNN